MKINKNINGNVIISSDDNEIEHVITSRVFIQKHPRKEDAVLISTSATNQDESDSIHLFSNQVTEVGGTAFSGSRNDLLETLALLFSTGGSSGNLGLQIDKYTNRYYVDAQNGDDTSAKPNDKSKPYRTINAAADAARNDFDDNSNKNLVHVFKGTYEEHSIIRNHVDMFCDDGVVIFTTGNNSVVNDIDEVMDDVAVMGKGVFLNRNNNGSNDAEGINFQRASKVSIEAKIIDSVQFWSDDAVEFTLSNCDIIVTCLHHNNKNISFEKCRFLNGIRTPSFKGSNTHLSYHKCEAIIPAYDTSDSRNDSLNIRDHNGELLFRMTSALFNPVSTDSIDAVLSEIDARTTAFDQSLTECVGIMYAQHDGDFNIDNLSVSHYGTVVRLQKENCVGVALVQKREPTNGYGRHIFPGVIVIDETESKNSIAVVTGKTHEGQPELDVNSISHNCSEQTRALGSLIEWDDTFSIIGAKDYQPKLSLGGSVFCIWAEENGDLNSNSYEWAYGNGNDTLNGTGVVLAFPCKLIGLGISIEGNATCNVEVYKNTSATGKRISTSNSKKNHVSFENDSIEYNAGDVINFKTITGSGSSNGGVVTAWFLAT